MWRLHIWLTTPIVSSLRPCAQRQDHGVGVGHCSLQSNSSSLIISERNLRPRASAAADSALVGRVWRLGGCGKSKSQLLKFSHFQIVRLSAKSQRVLFDCIWTFLRRCLFFGVRQIILWVFLLRMYIFSALYDPWGQCYDQLPPVFGSEAAWGGLGGAGTPANMSCEI